MIIRVAHEADAPAMGHVMVTTYLSAHRDQMPAEVWSKRAQEWTPELSAQGWAQTLRDIAAGEQPYECVYVAEDAGGDIVGLIMGGRVNGDTPSQIGEIYALYVRERYQGRGLGRQLPHVVAKDLAQHGATTLRIGCLAANMPARRFYEALGGQFVSERLFDEEGILLPEAVYEWADSATLGAKGQPEPKE